MNDPQRLQLLAGAYDLVSPEVLTHYIGGRFQPSPESQSVYNPATGLPLCQVASGNTETVDQAVAAAKAAAPSWRSRTPAERAAVLDQLADVVRTNIETFAFLESLNTGKPLSVVDEEMPLTADALRFFAGAIRTATAPAAGFYLADHISMVLREPVGVVGSITPWNYPLMMAIWKIGPALAAGNTVVLKPSELTPLTTLVFVNLTKDILPPGVLNVVLGTGQEVGQALAAHPDVAMISVTGSVRSGRAVAHAAASNLKRVHLELGGKAPVIVFPDCDPDKFAAAIRVSGYWNAGQECGAATRVLVHADAYEEVVKAMVREIETIRVGGPSDGEDIEMGPLISREHHARVAAMVRQAVADGATIATGGHEIDRPGSFYAPTLLVGVVPGSAITREEVFGPVVTVETFIDEEDAVRKANAVEYGLAASVWTKDVGRAGRVSAALDFGTVWVNSHLALVSEMPWGGFKASGYGRDMSVLALDDYTRTKHIMTNIGF